MIDLKTDIEKYLRGELTPAEMNALERRALNDPFLAEALEGAELLGSEKFQTDMKSLQTSLKERILLKPGRIVSLWVWPMRIAAGLLILAVSTFIIISLLDQNQSSKEIAQVKDNAPPVEADKTPLSADSISRDENQNKPDKKELLSLAKPEETRPLPSPLPPKINDETPLSRPANENQPTDDAQLAFKPQPESKKETTGVSGGYVDAKAISTESEQLAEVVQEPVVSKSEKADDKDLSLAEGISKRKVAAGAPTETASVGDRSKVSNTKGVRGKVTSAEDGTGLPGVNVVIKGTNTGTVTDAEGNYQLTVENANPALVFSFIGLESTEIEAGENQRVDVAMNQDISQLSEVVVVGYGAENKEEEEIPTLEFATPSGGRTAFKKYLEKSLRYPEQALENNIEGRVTVQFTVETSGKLTDFKVIKGLGYGCDDEVIRLIKQGPQWTATKRDDEPVKDQVKIRMRFRLPKK